MHGDETFTQTTRLVCTNMQQREWVIRYHSQVSHLYKLHTPLPARILCCTTFSFMILRQKLPKAPFMTLPLLCFRVKSLRTSRCTHSIGYYGKSPYIYSLISFNSPLKEHQGRNLRWDRLLAKGLLNYKLIYTHPERIVSSFTNWRTLLNLFPKSGFPGLWNVRE